MRLRTVAKDPGSGNGGCPSVHVDDEDNRIVVQGLHVPNEKLPDFLPDEGGVKIDPEILVDAFPAILEAAKRRAERQVPA